VDLNRYWERVLRTQGVAQTGAPKQYKNWSYKTVSQVIEKNVLPDVIDIVPGANHVGLMVIQGKENRYGTVKLEIPIYNMRGQEVHEFIFVINT
jgi:hypothetical protein